MTTQSDVLPWIDEAPAAIADVPADEPAALFEAPEAPEAPPVRPFLVLDASGVVQAVGYSNLAQEGGAWVSDEIYQDAKTRPGLCALVGGVLVDHVPPAVPDPAPLAVSKLGLVRALMATGMWAAVRARLDADRDLKDQWDAASEIAAADPMTRGMIAAMGLTDDQVAGLMRAAMAAAGAA